MAEASKYHTAEQNQQKQDAIDNAIRDLAFDYKAGLLASNRELMYHRVENINAMILELKRG